MTGGLEVEEVLDLDLRLLRTPAGAPLDPSAHRAALERSLPRSRHAAVRRGGALVAYAYLWPLEESGAWFAGGLAIAPGHRSAPVIRELRDTVANLLRAEGVRVLHSHVRTGNAASLRLHRRLGFREVRRSDEAVACVLDVTGPTFQNGARRAIRAPADAGGSRP
ncbi:GNAT family N-acetyltransferase [Wenxinia marina]|uniref:Sortase n=1 Tax=Wenxinia marina DSM 24838 TaxID=1123501 RepID=A0A0D0Q0Q9_9RHOB|nr:GNAT family N-acetyltransferase [Wenxinia marina]KIQ68139.1 Sortase [Wenxinia marina DSM 24838]GGL78602.1 hypothetical protein GCM10011392_36330 [Wenxinia marina]